MKELSALRKTVKDSERILEELKHNGKTEEMLEEVIFYVLSGRTDEVESLFEPYREREIDSMMHANEGQKKKFLLELASRRAKEEEWKYNASFKLTRQGKRLSVTYGGHYIGTFDFNQDEINTMLNTLSFRVPAIDREKKDVPKSKYKGVYWYEPKQKWRVLISEDGKSKSLGYFDNEEEAAEVYRQEKVKQAIRKVER